MCSLGRKPRRRYSRLLVLETLGTRLSAPLCNRSLPGFLSAIITTLVHWMPQRSVTSKFTHAQVHARIKGITTMMHFHILDYIHDLLVIGRCMLKRSRD
jgi:hypothetical protein